MKINKFTGSILGSLTLVAAAMAPSFAAPGDQQTFAGLNAINGGGNVASQVFTFSGGAGGTFSTPLNATFVASSALGAVSPASILTFTGLSATGQATGSGTALDPFTEGLSSGSFLVKDSSAANAATLLSGTFGSTNVLTAFNTGSTGSITATINDVTFTGGSFFTASGLVNKGSFSVNLSSLSPAATTTGGFLNAFKAGGGVTFSATTPNGLTPAPEPATFVPFALGGLSLFGLIVRGRKSRRTSGATA